MLHVQTRPTATVTLRERLNSWRANETRDWQDLTVDIADIRWSLVRFRVARLLIRWGVGCHVIYAAVLLPDPLKFALLADLHFLSCVLI